MKTKNYIFAFCKGAAIVFLLGGLLFPPPEARGAHKFLEYRVKAAFLYNFAKFVEWPGPDEAKASLPFVIGILGHDPFGPELDPIREKTINGRHIAVKHFDNPEDISGCDLLFVSHTDSEEIQRALEQTDTKPILTIGDAEGFAKAGGMIGFIEQQSKIRFEINRKAAARAGLAISSKLLKLAVIVDE